MAKVLQSLVRRGNNSRIAKSQRAKETLAGIPKTNDPLHTHTHTHSPATELELLDNVADLLESVRIAHPRPIAFNASMRDHKESRSFKQHNLRKKEPVIYTLIQCTHAGIVEYTRAGNTRRRTCWRTASPPAPQYRCTAKEHSTHEGTHGCDGCTPHPHP